MGQGQRSLESRSKVTWVNAKSHSGQGQASAQDIGRRAHINVKMHFYYSRIYNVKHFRAIPFNEYEGADNNLRPPSFILILFLICFSRPPSYFFNGIALTSLFDKLNHFRAIPFKILLGRGWRGKNSDTPPIDVFFFCQRPYTFLNGIALTYHKAA